MNSEQARQELVDTLRRVRKYHRKRGAQARKKRAIEIRLVHRLIVLVYREPPVLHKGKAWRG